MGRKVKYTAKEEIKNACRVGLALVLSYSAMQAMTIVKSNSDYDDDVATSTKSVSIKESPKSFDKKTVYLKAARENTGTGAEIDSSVIVADSSSMLLDSLQQNKDILTLDSLPLHDSNILKKVDTTLQASLNHR